MNIEAIGRRLQLGIVGGGPGSVIGDVHRAGARLDGYYDIASFLLNTPVARAPLKGSSKPPG
jgi:hypothetical protein